MHGLNKDTRHFTTTDSLVMFGKSCPPMLQVKTTFRMDNSGNQANYLLTYKCNVVAASAPLSAPKGM